jgi:Arylsulfotransferase (ASST)
MAALAAVGLVCLAAGFGYGLMTMQVKVFPYGLLSEVKRATTDLKDNWQMYLERRPTAHLEPTHREGRGVIVDDGAAVQPGLILMSGLFDDAGSSVRLIDRSGEIMRRWDTIYSRIWPDPGHLRDVPVNDWFADIHGLVLLPDGSIVFNFEYLGLSRIGACGNVLWRIPQETHHAIFLAEDNTLWVLSRRHHETSSPDFANMVPPFFDDTILQVSLDGEILQEISILGLIYKNKMEGILPTGERDTTLEYRDPLHANDVEVLASDLAAAYPSLKPGQVMVSLRVPNLILIFDPRTEEIVWHQTGPWLRQHDPDFREDGLISVFDNRGIEGDAAVFGGSRTLLVDPRTRETREAYPHREDNWFFTPTRGKHQILPNGNVLLVETSGGRVLEVASDGSIVWSYLNKYDENTVGKVQEAIHYPEGYLDAAPADCGEPAGTPPQETRDKLARTAP